jgi:tetratricopeptide (TPR) repeat protein
MEEGVNNMNAGNYEEADNCFKKVLRNLEVLPAEICFYFGKNSYYLSQFKQSINWLNKYIELKGTTGRFFEECVEMLEKSQQSYNLEQEINRQKIIEEFNSETAFDCKGQEYFMCPICRSEGVLIKPGKLSTLYQTCPACEGLGRLSCEKYKKYLKGELEISE